MSATNSIIDLLKRNDEKTIRTVYNDHKKRFILFAKRYNLSEHDTIDIYQDAFIALIENVKSGKVDEIKSSLSTYLFGIGKFMIFQKFKKNEQIHIADDLESIEVEDDLYSEDDIDSQVRLLQKGLDKLGEQCKKVLLLFYYEEKKLDEIQEQLGYTSKDVLKSQKSRCLKQLKELIKA